MKKTLVAYFSASGVTAKAAKILAEAAEADLYEIKPEVPYTTKDLDWMDSESRSSKEMKGNAPYPALFDAEADVQGHQNIMVCFPIWWYVAPTIINKFLESYDFTGKKIILFATSGGSGFGKTVEKLKDSVPQDVEIVEGKMLNGKQSKEQLKKWMEQAGL
ncbi:MAG: flavodoxin [Blautia sp.]